MSAPKGHRSALTSVFKYKIPDLQDSFALQDLICSFELDRPLQPVWPPAWDLVKGLDYLHGPVFEPLPSKPRRVVTMKFLFLLSLATAKRVGELQDLLFRVAFQSPDLSFFVFTRVCGESRVCKEFSSSFHFGSVVVGLCWASP